MSGTPLQYFAWQIPRMEEPGGLQSMGSLGVGHDWATLLFTFMHWRRKWQSTPVFLPGESRDGGAWWAAVSGVAQSRTWLKRLSSSSSSRMSQSSFFWGSKITADGDCSHEITRRLLLGRKVMTNLDSILKSKDINFPTKVCLVKAMFFPIVMYGCENWTIKKAEHWRIGAFELWCWSRLLKVPWTARRSN